MAEMLYSLYRSGSLRSNAMLLLGLCRPMYFIRILVYKCIVDRLTSGGSTANLCAIDLSTALLKLIIAHYTLK